MNISSNNHSPPRNFIIKKLNKWHFTGGKYKGLPISEAEHGYIHWVLENVELQKTHKTALTAALKHAPKKQSHKAIESPQSRSKPEKDGMMPMTARNTQRAIERLQEANIALIEKHDKLRREFEEVRQAMAESMSGDNIVDDDDIPY